MSKNTNDTNPRQPAGPQVGQVINGQMEFPPNFGVRDDYDKSLEDLEDEEAERKELLERKNVDHRDRKKEHLRESEGFETPEGLG